MKRSWMLYRFMPAASSPPDARLRRARRALGGGAVAENDSCGLRELAIEFAEESN
jgi:hypothetical protein